MKRFIKQWLMSLLAEDIQEVVALERTKMEISLSKELEVQTAAAVEEYICSYGDFVSREDLRELERQIEDTSEKVDTLENDVAYISENIEALDVFDDAQQAFAFLEEMLNNHKIKSGIFLKPKSML